MDNTTDGQADEDEDRLWAGAPRAARELHRQGKRIKREFDRKKWWAENKDKRRDDNGKTQG